MVLLEISVYHEWQERMSPPKAGKERRTCMLPVLDKVLSDHALMWKALGYLIGSVTSTYEAIRQDHALRVCSENAHFPYKVMVIKYFV